MMRWTWILWSALLAFANPSPAHAQAACDRACLRTMLDQYLNASSRTTRRKRPA